MPKTKTNFDVIFEKIEAQEEECKVFIEVSEIIELNEIRELGRIVSEITQPESRFLTTT